MRRAILGILLCTAGVVRPQGLSVDRPDFSESSNLIQAQALQWEVGSSKDQLGFAASAMVRWLPFNPLELRGSMTSEFETELGAKWKVLSRPKSGFALVGHVPLKSGVGPRIAIAADHSFCGYTFSWNLGMLGKQESTAPLPYVTHCHAVQVSPKGTVFVELVHFTGPTRIAPPGWTLFNVGGIFGIASDFALDAMCGWITGKSAPVVHLGLNYKWAFKTHLD